MPVSDLKQGDVLLWWSDSMSIQIGSRLWSIPIPMPIAVHADIYVGAGKCRTSIQNLGSSAADITKRMHQFYKWAAIRMLDIDVVAQREIVSVANRMTCQYDWQGYYGQYLDVFVSGETFPLPDFTSKSDLWTEKLASKTYDLMYCSSFVACCIWAGSKKVLAGKQHYVTSPQDIYDYATNNKSTRQIIHF